MQMKFIKSLEKQALSIYSKYSILPSLSISQACLESGYGRHHIENNLFGIKSTPSWSGTVVERKTKEFVNGRYVDIVARFRAYDSFSDSLEDYARLLFLNSRYKAVIGELDYKKAANAVYQAGYATDPKYPQKLISIIERYRLFELDNRKGLVNIAVVANGVPYYVSGYFRDNVNYIPVAFLRKLGFVVEWDREKRAVKITTVKDKKI